MLAFCKTVFGVSVKLCMATASLHSALRVPTSLDSFAWLALIYNERYFF